MSAQRKREPPWSKTQMQYFRLVFERWRQVDQRKMVNLVLERQVAQN